MEGGFVFLSLSINSSGFDVFKTMVFLLLRKILFMVLPNVIRDISPNDKMFVPNSEERYFEVGESAFESIKIAMLLAKKEVQSIKNILDLPCGHGRVLRMLRACFQNSRIVACDLDKDGVDFCHRTFNAIPVYSQKKTEQIPIKEKFDLIWCGSLFTHLNIDDFQDFLAFFESILSSQGILVFTTHGRRSIDLIKKGKDYGLDSKKLTKLVEDFENNGFGFQQYEGQEDYGISESSPRLDQICHLFEVG